MKSVAESDGFRITYEQKNDFRQYISRIKLILTHHLFTPKQNEQINAMISSDLSSLKQAEIKPSHAISEKESLTSLVKEAYDTYKADKKSQSSKR